MRQRRPLGLTPRGALLVVVLFILAAASVYPLRQHAQQSARIAELKAKQAALERANAELERERQRLRDPAYIEQLAKEHLHYVYPGEEAWVLSGVPPTTPPTTAPPTTAPPSRGEPEGSLLRHLWQHLRDWVG